MAKLTIKKINEFIKDEKMAAAEYARIYKENPEFRDFIEMSHDERNHYKKLLKIKEKLRKIKK